MSNFVKKSGKYWVSILPAWIVATTVIKARVEK